MKNQKGNPNQIKPNELRIGNIVTIDNEKYHPSLKNIPLQIKGIYENSNGWCVTLDKIVKEPNTYYESYSQMIEFIEPIPLTEELLLKCGFEPIPHFTVVNSHTIGLGRSRVLSIGNTENANQMAWIESVDGSTVTDLICVHNFDYDGKMHLHQLQNLYFALTGEELKIEL